MTLEPDGLVAEGILTFAGAVSVGLSVLFSRVASWWTLFFWVQPKIRSRRLRVVSSSVRLCSLFWVFVMCERMRETYCSNRNDHITGLFAQEKMSVFVSVATVACRKLSMVHWKALVPSCVQAFGCMPCTRHLPGFPRMWHVVIRSRAPFLCRQSGTPPSQFVFVRLDVGLVALLDTTFSGCCWSVLVLHVGLRKCTDDGGVWERVCGQVRV